ncbi:DUF6508 domain-containing protein [Paenibacillus sp. JTLBN-2024]|uniref:CdiI immunity protein domain-containing protein n=1 Tax=Paenibacillus cookii TaxID=157839 RepID=A0ABQ4M0I2_9BACL|nr:DUF6508 domain-containing protein [Paenibacillus cookii]GIO69004.1 hypothetical protein J21TS3_38250 [Paenibacillus cookii]
MPYDATITSGELDRLLPFLNVLQDPNQPLSAVSGRYRFETEVVRNFVQELSNTGFMMVFDWSSWVAEHEIYRDIDRDIEDHLMQADLETLRKLVTSYVRGDRFTEGVWIRVLENGKMTQILKRLKMLREEMQE